MVVQYVDVVVCYYYPHSPTDHLGNLLAQLLLSPSEQRRHAAAELVVLKVELLQRGRKRHTREEGLERAVEVVVAQVDHAYARVEHEAWQRARKEVGL